jgi:hypothetical protein
VNKLYTIMAVVLLAVLGVFAATAVAGGDKPPKPKPAPNQVIFGGQDQTICHATASEDGGNQHNGYNIETVSVDSIVKDNGHGSHTDIGGKSDVIPAFSYTITYKYPGNDWPDETVSASYGGLGGGDISTCKGGDEEPVKVQASVTFNDPTCETPAGYVAGPTTGVTYTLTSGTVGPGNTITVTATANEGYVLDGKSVFEHTFTTPTGCEQEDIPVTAGVTFTEATCSAGAGVSYANSDKVTYAITGGTVAAGSSVTITATAKDGYTLGEGQSVFEHTFAAAPTNCGTPPPGDRCPPGMTPTAGKDGQPGNDECEFPKGPPTSTSTPTPPATPPAVTPPAATPPVTPPAATPTPKAKPKVTKKKVTSVKKKVVRKAAPRPDRPHVCLPLKDGTQRKWWKGGNGLKAGCYAVIQGSG